MGKYSFWMYLLVSAGITYLIRMVPLVLIKRKIKNKFLLSFLYYIPYTVLSVMTIPAIFYSTSGVYSAVVGFAVAAVLAYFKKSLINVAAFSCMAVLISEFIMSCI